jgi:hypothetical protein
VKPFHCSHPEHQGDRVISRYEAIEERLDWRRKSDDQRYRTLHIRYVCRSCADIDIARAEHDPLSQQEAMTF